MGRKIPGRKHRGVRDPEKQHLERLNSLKDKINAPPTDPDDQQVPKSLQRLMDLKNKVKSGYFSQRRTKREPHREMFEQFENETDRDFLYRVNRQCAIVKHEAAFENKFGVEVKRGEDGEVVIKKRAKDPVLMMVKEVKRKKREKKLKKKEEGPRLTKSQKRSRKLLERKKRKAGDDVDGFEKFRDVVRFGEQVHEPPTLNVHKKLKNNVKMAGEKSLLLKPILNKTQNSVIDKTIKRKKLPNALRRQLDKQQEQIIEAYKKLKKRKT